MGWLCLLYKPNELLVIKIHGECYNHGKTLDTLFTFSVSDKLYFKIKIILSLTFDGQILLTLQVLS